ncbi:isochorismatase family protein [Mycolicibacter sinensis]
MSAPRRALVVVDAQQEYFDGLLPIQYPPREESISRIGELIDAAKASDIPVVVVKHEFPAGAPVFAAGSPTCESHPIVAKYEADADNRITEVISDATGAIDIANDAGFASAQQVHETLMALLHSNWAAVTGTSRWKSAIATGHALDRSDLGSSAATGRAAHQAG